MDISVQKFAEVGLTPTFVAAGADGDTYTNAGVTYLFVKNDGPAAIEVTIDSVRKCDQGFDHDEKVTVEAGTTGQLGPFPFSRFNNAGQKVAVSYSDVTDVTVAVVRV